MAEDVIKNYDDCGDCDKYDIEYMGVRCTGVKWRYGRPNILYFTKDGNDYQFEQAEYIRCSADTDYIRCVIEYYFLPYLEKMRTKEIERENTQLKERNEELQKEIDYWKSEVKTARKDIDNAVNEIIERFEKENAELKARLEVTERALREFAVQSGCKACVYKFRCDHTPIKNASNDYQSCYDTYLREAHKDLAELKGGKE